MTDVMACMCKWAMLVTMIMPWPVSMHAHAWILCEAVLCVALSVAVHARI